MSKFVLNHKNCGCSAPNTKSSMRKWASAVAIVGALFAALLYGGPKWAPQSFDPIGTQSDAYMLAGQHAGQHSSESGCLTAGLERHISSPTKTINMIVLNSVQMSACLQKSRYSDGFCDAVPVSSDIAATGRWMAKACEQLGLKGDMMCNSFLQTVDHYCNSADHTGKQTTRRSKPI